LYDTDGLSVGSSHEAAKQLQNSGWGVAALEILGINQLGLPVDMQHELHGYIQNVPYDAPETYDRAMEIADRLLELALPNLTPDHWRRD
jgi:hypothetical protein